MKDISIKQQQILDYINAQTKRQGYPPTVREICSAVGLKTTSTVHGHLLQLQKRGLLSKSSAKTRALKVINNEETAPSFQVPILGKVTAGQPILAVENHEGYFPLPASFEKKGELFILQVRGESMINAGILDGDYIIVSRQQTAENGEKIVALIEDEATVKTFYKENGYYRLQPENDAMEPIFLKEVSIIGKVIALFRGNIS